MTNQLPPPRRVSLFERGLVAPEWLKTALMLIVGLHASGAACIGVYVIAAIAPLAVPGSDDSTMLIEIGSVFIGFGAAGLFFTARGWFRRREKKAREARMAPFRRR